MRIFRKIFSIKENDPTHKTITILGVRIKLHHPPTDAHLFHHLPIQNNKIVFNSVFGAYQCSPKYIAEEIRRQGLPYDLVWVVNQRILYHIDSFPKDIRLVMRGTSDALRELATAKVWIENERKLGEVLQGLRKRPGQVYINTWHGSLGIKKTGAQRNDITRRARMLSEADSSQMDYLISNSSYTTEFYKEIFWNYGESKEYGCPRNDVFFSPEQAEIRRLVCERLHISPTDKILLYAPTWRDDGATDCFTLDYTRALAAARKKFGGNWSMLVRLHHRMHELRDIFFPSDTSVIDASDYPDMQELLVAADMVITDYSSCIYDFLLTRRPGFIYAPDMQKYSNGRGLCYPLQETPFPLATDNSELERNIIEFNTESYKANVEIFLKKKGSLDDGHASQRTVELIKNILNN